jgi:hypothetical protein
MSQTSNVAYLIRLVYRKVNFELPRVHDLHTNVVMHPTRGSNSFFQLDLLPNQPLFIHSSFKCIIVILFRHNTPPHPLKVIAAALRVAPTHAVHTPDPNRPTLG